MNADTISKKTAMLKERLLNKTINAQNDELQMDLLKGYIYNKSHNEDKWEELGDEEEDDDDDDERKELGDDEDDEFEEESDGNDDEDDDLEDGEEDDEDELEDEDDDD